MEHKNCLKKVTAVFSAHEAAPIWKLRHFAVLALLTEIGGELHFILTKRAAGVNQPGDVCFPGGHREQGETLVKPLSEKPRRKSASLKRIFAFWGKVTSC